VRILLFRECEKRGLKLLYDSSTVYRVAVSSLQDLPTPLQLKRSSCPPPTTAPTRGASVSTAGEVPTNTDNSASKRDNVVLEVTNGYAYKVVS